LGESDPNPPEHPRGEIEVDQAAKDAARAERLARARTDIERTLAAARANAA